MEVVVINRDRDSDLKVLEKKTLEYYSASGNSLKLVELLASLVSLSMEKSSQDDLAAGPVRKGACVAEFLELEESDDGRSLPSLAALEAIEPSKYSMEVVVINRDRDSDLKVLEKKTLEYYSASGNSLKLVELLASLVSLSMDFRKCSQDDLADGPVRKGACMAGFLELEASGDFFPLSRVFRVFSY
ncbi:hypothetical protein KSP39_PZI019274 [Platanthera zijinensis]|uniref:EDR1/CTR1/ARMC3-like peptidase-like domain-containing protein n=1 Tax=Platanthera zijinensis TaxID=2320716 RepID=A0AAP0B1H7_9ASPA